MTSTQDPYSITQGFSSQHFSPSHSLADPHPKTLCCDRSALLPPKRPRQPTGPEEPCRRMPRQPIPISSSASWANAYGLHERRKAVLRNTKTHISERRERQAERHSRITCHNWCIWPAEKGHGEKKEGAFGYVQVYFALFWKATGIHTYINLNGSHVFSGIEQHAMYARRENPIYAACRAHKRFFLPVGSCSSSNTLVAVEHWQWTGYIMRGRSCFFRCPHSTSLCGFIPNWQLLRMTDDDYQPCRYGWSEEYSAKWACKTSDSFPRSHA